MFIWRKLNQCSITLTHNCNLRCSFCYAKATNYDTKNIEITKVKKLIDFCDDLNVKYIVFTGGEPLLYPQLVEILKYIKTKKNIMVPTIATNGIKLQDESFCKELIRNGIEYFDISLKGKNEIEWQLITGQNSLLQQQKAIQNLSKLNVNFTCSMVLCQSNIESFIETIAMAKNNGAKSFSFTFEIDNNYDNENGISYLKKKNPFELINKFISEIDKLYEITNDWWIEYSYPLCMYTEAQLKILKNRLAAPCQVHMKNGITVDTEMKLIPCNMCLDTPIGQFEKDFISYKEFYLYNKNQIVSKIMKSLRKFPSNRCNFCKYKKDCYGGCPILWRNYSFEDLIQFKKSLKKI